MYMLFAASFLLVSGSVFAGVIARPVAQQEAMSTTFDWWPYPDFTETASSPTGPFVNRTIRSTLAEVSSRSSTSITSQDHHSQSLLATGSSSSTTVATTSGALIVSGNQPLYFIILAAVGGVGFGMLFSFILYRHHRIQNQPQTKPSGALPKTVCEARVSLSSYNTDQSCTSATPTIARYPRVDVQSPPSTSISDYTPSSDFDVAPLTVTMSEQPLEHPNRSIIVVHGSENRPMHPIVERISSFLDRRSVESESAEEIGRILRARTTENQAEWARLKLLQDREYSQGGLTYRSPRPGKTGLGITVPPSCDASASISKFDRHGHLTLPTASSHPPFQ